MTYDISDDEIPHEIRHGLRRLGWVWDAGSQEWRKHNERGAFSPLRGDHIRAFNIDVATVVADLAKPSGGNADAISSPQVSNHDATVGSEVVTINEEAHGDGGTGGDAPYHTD